MNPDDIDRYAPSAPCVQSVDHPWLTLFGADDLPTPGHLVSIDDQALALVFQHLGNSRALAWLPPASSTSSITQGAPITPLHRPAITTLAPANHPIDPASLPLTPHPPTSPTSADDLVLWPNPPDWTDLQPQRPALPIDLPPLDSLAPLATDGTHLIIDLSPDDQAFHSLCHRVHHHLQPASTLLIHPTSDGLITQPTAQHWHLQPTTLGARIYALQLAIALSPRLRQSPPALAVIDLPTPPSATPNPTGEPDPLTRGIPDIIDRLATHLVATQGASLTTLLRLHIPASSSGLQTIIDTLHLGDVDATITIDHDGRFDPHRSHSRAELDSRQLSHQRELHRLLHRAQKIRDKAHLLDDDMLTEDEHRILSEAKALYTPLK